MQSDYASTFGLGIIHHPSVSSAIHAIDDENHYYPHFQKQQPSTNVKRTRYNSVETESPKTTTPTNTTSSSSTDTVTPLHAKAVAALAASSASAVLRRSHSIKMAAQLMRKNAVFRSLSHTYTLPTATATNEHELEHLRFKYESFCNNEDDDEDEETNPPPGQYDQDADDDDDDERESLLHHKIHHKASTEYKPVEIPSLTSDKDVNSLNNNPNLKNNLSLDDNLKVVIVNSNSSANLVGKFVKNHRTESIRMRHHSNIASGAGFDENQSSSTKLKYFKCKKTNKHRSKASQRRHNYLVIFLLFVVNLLNYIDRYTLAGIINRLLPYFFFSISYFFSIFFFSFINFIKIN